jgi:hypothetical protein
MISSFTYTLTRYYLYSYLLLFILLLAIELY